MSEWVNVIINGREHSAQALFFEDPAGHQGFTMWVAFEDGVAYPEPKYFLDSNGTRETPFVVAQWVPTMHIQFTKGV